MKCSKFCCTFASWIALLSLSIRVNGAYLVCYYNQTAVYRPGLAKLEAENIDPTLCTHYVYGYAFLNEKTLHIQASDHLNDVNNHAYLRFTGLQKQNPQAKFMIGLGGPMDSKSHTEKYSTLVSNASNINALVNSVVDFLQTYNFDGLSFDWIFPFSSADQMGYSNLIIALKTAFKPYGFLLSSTVTSLQDEINFGYNITAMNQNLDFVNLWTFDYHTPYFEPSLAQHHSPLYPRQENLSSHSNSNYSVSYWIKKGLSPSLINLGIPFYGYSWSLTSNSSILPRTANGPGPAGFLTNIEGFLAYYEICSNVFYNDWIENVGSADGIDPTYAVSPNTNSTIFVGYDDPFTVLIKADYILEKGLGGAMVWDISLDDFANLCEVSIGLKKIKIGANPLLNIIATILQPSA